MSEFLLVLGVGIFTTLISLGIGFLFIVFTSKTIEQEDFEWAIFEQTKKSIEDEIGMELPYYFFYRQEIIDHILRTSGVNKK